MKSNEEDNMARSIVKKWIFGLCGLFVLAFCPQNGLSAETAIKGKSPDLENNCSLRKYFSYSKKKVWVSMVSMMFLFNFKL